MVIELTYLWSRNGYLENKEVDASMWLKIGNFIWFQTIWWTIILFQNDAVIPVFALIGIWVVISPLRLDDMKLMAIMFFVGTIIDGLLTYGGLFIFEEESPLIPFWPIPIWLSLLWVAFSGTVYHSMTAFKGRYILCAMGGAVFAPLSYIAGAKFEAVELGTSTVFAYAIIALVWSIIFPLCFYISDRIQDGGPSLNWQGEKTYD